MTMPPLLAALAIGGVAGLVLAFFDFAIALLRGEQGTVYPRRRER